MYVYPVRRKKENNERNIKYHERTVLFEGHISFVRKKKPLWHTHIHTVSRNYTHLPNIDLFSIIIGWMMEEKTEIRIEKENKIRTRTAHNHWHKAEESRIRNSRLGYDFFCSDFFSLFIYNWNEHIPQELRTIQ